MALKVENPFKQSDRVQFCGAGATMTGTVVGRYQHANSCVVRWDANGETTTVHNSVLAPLERETMSWKEQHLAEVAEQLLALCNKAFHHPDRDDVWSTEELTVLNHAIFDGRNALKPYANFTGANRE